jgi:hypothetical protein
MALEQLAVDPTALNSNLSKQKASSISIWSRSTSEFSYYVQFKSFSSGDNFPAVTPSSSAILLLIALQ